MGTYWHPLRKPYTPLMVTQHEVHRKLHVWVDHKKVGELAFGYQNEEEQALMGEALYAFADTETSVKTPGLHHDGLRPDPRQIMISEYGELSTYQGLIDAQP